MRIIDKIVIHSEGSLQVSCTFECLVMKPPLGSILNGTLMEQSSEGLTVLLGDQAVQIQEEGLIQPAHFQQG